jgi:hypothetical protein
VPPSADGGCSNALVARLSGGPAGLALGDVRLDAESARAVRLKDTDRELLLMREEAHPRGGYQPRLYGYGAAGVAEVTEAGQPLLGFVATDSAGLPSTATCADDGGISFLVATTHEPPGVVLAWDVVETTYSLDGTDAEEASATEIESAVPDPVLQRRMPQLFEPGAYFADCLAPGGHQRSIEKR